MSNQLGLKHRFSGNLVLWCERGFTLIEVMVATAFFSVVLVTVLNVHVRASALKQRSHDYEIASHVLINMSELVQTLAPEQLAELMNKGTGSSFTRDGSTLKEGGEVAFYEVFLELIPRSGQYKQVNIRAQWLEQKEIRMVSADVLVNLP